jgi:hypothetical protein
MVMQRDGHDGDEKTEQRKNNNFFNQRLPHNLITPCFFMIPVQMPIIIYHKGLSSRMDARKDNPMLSLLKYKDYSRE